MICQPCLEHRHRMCVRFIGGECECERAEVVHLNPVPATPVELTILESEAFWDELIKRSPEAETIFGQYGKFGMKGMLRAAFELKAEYEQKMKESA